MIVCSCLEVSECELREAVATAPSIEAALLRTGAGSACGVCRDQVFQVVAGRPCPAARCPGCSGGGGAGRAG